MLFERLTKNWGLNGLNPRKRLTVIFGFIIGLIVLGFLAYQHSKTSGGLTTLVNQASVSYCTAGDSTAVCDPAVNKYSGSSSSNLTVTNVIGIPSPSPTPIASPSPTPIPTASPTPSPTPTQVASASPSTIPLPSIIPSPTALPSLIPTPTPRISPLPSPTLTIKPSPLPSVTISIAPLPPPPISIQPSSAAASSFCLQIALGNRQSGNYGIAAVSVTVGDTTTRTIQATYTGPANSSGRIIVTVPAGFNPNQSHVVLVKVPGYLARKHIFSNLNSSCNTFPSDKALIAGDFSGGDNKISLADIITFIKHINGTKNSIIDATYGREVRLSDLIGLIRSFNTSKGDTY